MCLLLKYRHFISDIPSKPDRKEQHTVQLGDQRSDTFLTNRAGYNGPFRVFKG